MSGKRISQVGFSTMGGQADMTDLAATLDRFSDIDISTVELSLFCYGVLVGGKPIVERVRKLRQICSARPFTYTVHGPIALNFFDLDRLALHKEVCRAAVDLTAELDASLLVIHAGIADLSSGEQPDEHYARQRDVLREMGDYAAKANVRLAVENVFVEKPGLHTADPARLGQELAAIDHDHVCGTLDVSHAHIASTWSGFDGPAAIQRFAPQVGHLHIHDSFGRPARMKTYTPQENLAYGMGDLHMPMGWGSIDWAGLLTNLPVLPETCFMVELARDYWDYLEPMVIKARGLAALVDTSAEPKQQLSA